MKTSKIRYLVFGLIAVILAAFVALSLTGCPGPEPEPEPEPDLNVPPEDLPVAERWGKYGGETSVTLEYSVASDGVCTITVKGTPNNSAWLATATYSYTAKADACYIYEFEAWTESGSGDRGFVLQYYYDAADGGKYLQFFPTITEERKTYTYKGSKLPKGGVRSMDFQSARKIGTYYVKVLSIKEYTPSLEYELIDDADSPNNGTYRVSSGAGMSGAVVIPASYNGKPVTEIGWHAFLDAGITSVTIPTSITIIRNGAFSNCANLATVTFAANSQLESIGYGAFAFCTSLTGITIPANVTDIDASFYGSVNLTSITVAAGNNRYTNENGILYSKDKTWLVAYPSASGNITILEGVTVIGGAAFRSCKNLTGVIIPASVTGIDYHAFIDCTNIPSITIPATVENMGGAVFEGWTSSQTIYIEGYADEAAADAAWDDEYSNWRENCEATIVYQGT